MLGYNPAGKLAYDPTVTGLSLIFAILGCGISVSLIGLRKVRWRWIPAGVTFGLTVSTMHYVGMYALEVPGRFEWRYGLVGVSVAAGCLLGIVMVHRIIRPLTRYCWLGGTLAMVLGVCAMHFTGMAAAVYVPDTEIYVRPQNLSNFVLGFVVLVVVSVILLIGFMTFMIETEMSAENQQKLSDAVRHDLLTGLPNRVAFRDHVAALQKRLDGGAIEGIAVLALDLDGFKKVNDSLGHNVGDQLLCHLAAAAQNVLEPEEFFARVGGDEFVAVKAGNASWQDADDFAHRLIAAIETPLDVRGRRIRPAMSIGIATCPEDGTDLQELLNCADLAMYRAKSENSDKIQFYDQEMERHEREKSALLVDLKQAVEQGGLSLNYQLQNNVRTSEVVGFEVLARWTHPALGPIGPDRFIPLAEEGGLIDALGAWVLRTACVEAASWDIPFPIAVNVSPSQLADPSFPQLVDMVLKESGLPANRLEIEITEATIIDDEENAFAVLYRLKSMGIRIAMDDFGTGYSSLATLRAFPFDKIKIDRSFVRDVHTSTQNAAIVRSTLLLGAALNVPVLAEGAETAEEIAFLASEACFAAQGYHYGRPMSVEDVRRQTMKEHETA